MPRLIGGAAALAAVAAVGVGASATASNDSDKAGAATIKMVQEGKSLLFEGPATVAAGDTLKIKDTTDPRKVGPHTFSLVQKSAIPTEPKDIKACGKKLELICGAIAEWHEVNLETGEFAVNPVEAGEDGWDKSGSLKREGDSWASLKKGDKFAQEVTADSGTTLRYFCAVHPEMVGKIKVED